MQRLLYFEIVTSAVLFLTKSRLQVRYLSCFEVWQHGHRMRQRKLLDVISSNRIGEEVAFSLKGQSKLSFVLFAQKWGKPHLPIYQIKKSTNQNKPIQAIFQSWHWGSGYQLSAYVSVSAVEGTSRNFDHI